MATPQDSGSIPARPSNCTTATPSSEGKLPTPANLGLEAAVREAGEYPERAAKLAAMLGFDLPREKGGQK